MGIFNSKWPFYLSGSLLALTAMLSLYFLNDVIGMGDALTMIGEYGVKSIDDGTLADAPPLNYQMGFLIGIFLGAFTAALFSSNFKIKFLADCGGGFTARTFKTVICGFCGGFLVMLGVQLAGESIWGQLVAAMQLSAAAWLFLVGMTVSGATLALLLERRGDLINEGSDT